MRDPVERFWSKVKKEGPVPPHCPELGPCWEWTGTVMRSRGNRAYFQTQDRKMHIAARYLWAMLNGPAPHRMHVLHKCDNPQCVNPSHPFLGTTADNNRDRAEKGRSCRGERHWTHTNPEKLNPRRGDQHGLRLHTEAVHRGEGHHGAKLTEEQVREIRSRYVPRKVTLDMLAREYSVSYGLIGRIVRGEGWKHVA